MANLLAGGPLLVVIGVPQRWLFTTGRGRIPDKVDVAGRGAELVTHAEDALGQVCGV